MNLSKYRKLQRAVEEAKTRHDQAVGRAKQLQRQLRANFGCKTLKEAKALYAKTERQEAEAEQAFEAAQDKFNRKYNDALFNAPDRDKEAD